MLRERTRGELNAALDKMRSMRSEILGRLERGEGKTGKLLDARPKLHGIP